MVAFGSGQHPTGSQLKCTYISIPQAHHTYAVVLSKPTWMWGAEMGANQVRQGQGRWEAGAEYGSGSGLKGCG